MVNETKLLEIAAQLLAGMPSDLARLMNNRDAAQWAIDRASALCDAFTDTQVEVPA